ncbi:HAAS domain-containing protein [Staphylococcus sp. 17KM0847]|uniref:HAAS signaling domain-containing protein n=1 Tax=Staphylococcus sp. 17KM0847 TaxID=2583989 RepID=UPI0015DC4CBA|nr:DUF1700 domain-containing protein [Staphylococcus sp. 17KM0847]QLK86705.1 DUF1700 domain-containing protein [Staphylococcus sp. 17KM0847]
MTKKDYLNILYEHLKNIPEQEKQEIVAEYDNHFIEGAKDGKSETEMIEMLGDPKIIAKDIVAESAVNQASENHSAQNVFLAVLAVIGLSFVNLVLVLGPLMLLLGLLFGLIVATGILLISPFIALGSYFLNNDVQLLLPDWLAALGYFGIGMMLYVVTFYLVKWSCIGFVKYLKLNIKLVKRSARA